MGPAVSTKKNNTQTTAQTNNSGTYSRQEKPS